VRRRTKHPHTSHACAGTRVIGFPGRLLSLTVFLISTGEPSPLQTSSSMDQFHRAQWPIWSARARRQSPSARVPVCTQILAASVSLVSSTTSRVCGVQHGCRSGDPRLATLHGRRHGEHRQYRVRVPEHTEPVFPRFPYVSHVSAIPTRWLHSSNVTPLGHFRCGCIARTFQREAKRSFGVDAIAFGGGRSY
jgi:hypothetical protein